ncbi:MAG: hypothetical protein GY797_12360 [Deltaproteobacteria bacterium]|nr:hypothetical protein [Deltaproteobacteria bacterium]
MATIIFPPQIDVFDNDESKRRIRSYYSDTSTDIKKLVSRLYSGRDITPLYDQIIFKPTEITDPYVFDVEVIATGQDSGANNNIQIPSLSVKQLLASSLAYVRPDLATSGRPLLQRKAEAEIQEISRVTLEIGRDGFSSAPNIHEVTITNNCTPQIGK